MRTLFALILTSTFALTACSEKDQSTHPSSSITPSAQTDLSPSQPNLDPQKKSLPAFPSGNYQKCKLPNVSAVNRTMVDVASPGLLLSSKSYIQRLSPDRVAVSEPGDSHHKVLIYDADGKLIRNFEIPDANMDIVVWPNGTFAVGTVQGSVKIFDADGLVLHERVLGNSPIRLVSMGRDGSLWALDNAGMAFSWTGGSEVTSLKVGALVSLQAGSNGNALGRLDRNTLVRLNALNKSSEILTKSCGANEFGSCWSVSLPIELEDGSLFLLQEAVSRSCEGCSGSTTYVAEYFASDGQEHRIAQLDLGLRLVDPFYGESYGPTFALRNNIAGILGSVGDKWLDSDKKIIRQEFIAFTGDAIQSRFDLGMNILGFDRLDNMMIAGNGHVLRWYDTNECALTAELENPVWNSPRSIALLRDQTAVFAAWDDDKDLSVLRFVRPSSKKTETQMTFSKLPPSDEGSHSDGNRWIWSRVSVEGGRELVASSKYVTDDDFTVSLEGGGSSVIKLKVCEGRRSGPRFIAVGQGRWALNCTYDQILFFDPSGQVQEVFSPGEGLGMITPLKKDFSAAAYSDNAAGGTYLLDADLKVVTKIEGHSGIPFGLSPEASLIVTQRRTNVSYHLDEYIIDITHWPVATYTLNEYSPRATVTSIVEAHPSGSFLIATGSSLSWISPKGETLATFQAPTYQKREVTRQDDYTYTYGSYLIELK